MAAMVGVRRPSPTERGTPRDGEKARGAEREDGRRDSTEREKRRRQPAAQENRRGPIGVGAARAAQAPAPNFPVVDQSCVALDARRVSFVPGWSVLLSAPYRSVRSKRVRAESVSSVCWFPRRPAARFPTPAAAA